MNPDAAPPLDAHISKTYSGLRNGIGWLAIALPLVLSLWGYWKHGLPPQDSISAYYHAFVPSGKPPGLLEVAGNGVMRNWFVGILWAIGVFLVLYRGYGRRENIALNFAGVLLIMVAMFPMDWTCGTACPKIPPAANWLLKSRGINSTKSDLAAIKDDLVRGSRKEGFRY